MNIDSYVPSRLRSSYTLKVATVIVIAAVVTVVCGLVLYVNAAGQLDDQSEQSFEQQASSDAQLVALWARSNEATARELARQTAETSPEALERQLEQTRSDRSRELSAIHYVDPETGSVIASTADGTEPPLPTGVAPEQTPVRQGAGESVQFLASGEDGVIVIEADGATLRDRFGSSEIATTVVRDGEVLLRSNREGLDAEIAGAVQPGGLERYTDGDGTAHTAVATDLETKGLTTVSHVPEHQLYGSRTTTRAAVTAIVYVLVLNLLIAGIVVGGNLSLSLRRLTQRAATIREGEFDVELETDRVDEVGVLYQEFDSMRVSLRESLSQAQTAREQAESAREDAETARERAEQSQQETERLNERLEAEAQRYGEVMNACAAGDLTRRLDPEVDSVALQSIATSFNEMMDELEATVADVGRFATEVQTASSDVEALAESVQTTTEAVDETLQEISADANEQNESVRTVAAEVDELSASIEEVAATTNEVTSESDRVAELGAEGRDTAEATIEEMREIEATTAELADTIKRLDESAESIGGVVDLIDDIAEQTNILALNASIEAARAGDGGGGDGFGVVADEVKSLAEETQHAVSEIDEMVAEIREQTDRSAEEIRTAERRVSSGIDSVRTLANAMDEIVNGVEVVDSGLKDINRTTDTQASSAQEIVAMVDNVSKIADATSNRSETVAADASEAAAAVGQVSEEVNDLSERAKRLEAALSEFQVAVEEASTADSDQ